MVSAISEDLKFVSEVRWIVNVSFTHIVVTPFRVVVAR